MKRFMDIQGTFEIMVPANWLYSISDQGFHTFNEYNDGNSDCFELSFYDLKDTTEKENLAHHFGFLKPTIINGWDYRSYPDETSDDDSWITKTWTTIIGSKAVLFGFTFDFNKEIIRNPSILKNKIKTIRKIIASFDFIDESESEKRLNSYRFEMFLQGIGASALILNRAIENKSFIEATCLFATQIDSLLRIAIVLQKQILNKNDTIDREWIYQGPEDKRKTEKDVYKTAKELNIIDDEVLKELFRLYEDRNRVIHRFIISEITLADVEQIAYRYLLVLNTIAEIVDNLEGEQIKLNIGITIQKPGDHLGDKSHNLAFIMGKIGKLNFFDLKKSK